MTKEELEQLKKELLTKRKSIIEQLQKVAGKNPAVPGDFEPVMPNLDDGSHDDDETLNEATQFGTDIAMEGELEHQLEEINRALERIEVGSYGTCSNCTTHINPYRLKALPTAALCISCAQKVRKS